MNSATHICTAWSAANAFASSLGVPCALAIVVTDDKGRMVQISQEMIV